MGAKPPSLPRSGKRLKDTAIAGLSCSRRQGNISKDRQGFPRNCSDEPSALQQRDLARSEPLACPIPAMAGSFRPASFAGQALSTVGKVSAVATL
jgi:hypothetical protein